MQFRDFAENLLGSRVKIKIIRRLLSDEAITSERELAKLIGVSHVAVNKTLKEFHDANFISPLRVGAAIVWQLNKKSYAYYFLTNFKEAIKSTPLEELKKGVHKYFNRDSFIFDIYLPLMPGALVMQIKKIVIYGSVAIGNELPDSDIDLFALVGTENDRKAIDNYLSELNNAIIRRYGNRLSLNVFTMKDFSSQKNKKFLENVSKGITVFER